MQMTVHLFGKPGCSMCELMGKRLDALCRGKYGEDASVVHHMMDDEESIVLFCLARELNPSRIPSFYVSEGDGESPLARPEGEERGELETRTIVGLQTDWSNGGEVEIGELERALENGHRILSSGHN